MGVSGDHLGQPHLLILLEGLAAMTTLQSHRHISHRVWNFWTKQTQIFQLGVNENLEAMVEEILHWGWNMKWQK